MARADLTVDQYRAALAPEIREIVDTLRAIVSESSPHLVERIKWNAPSFAIDDDDRITLGIAPKGGVRVVLHRGAKAKATAGFHFDDEAGLASWPTQDRGAIIFSNAQAVESRREALKNLFARWVVATTSKN
jgi:hypothetical protein